MKYIKLLVLLVVIIFISFLYFYKLDSVPSGLYVDEALSGYNAYSIIETGRDEYSKLFPLSFRLFGSYSPPLYTYLTTVSISKFGLNDCAPAQSPSAAWRIGNPRSNTL